MPITDIPPEILHQIIDITRQVERFETSTSVGTRAVRNRTVLHVALVSRYFRDLSERVLFDHLSWYINSPISTHPEERQQAIKLQENARLCSELLLAKPHLRLFVRSLSIDATSLGINIGRERKPVMDSVQKALPVLSNLKTLSLTGVQINILIYEAIIKLNHLEALSIKGPWFDEAELPAIASLPGPSTLSSLVTENTGNELSGYLKNVWENLVFSDSLQWLAIDGGVADMVCDKSQSRGELRGLKGVAIVLRNDREREVQLMQFLERCPEVEEISISFRRRFSEVPVQLSSSSLPKLRKYKGGYGCAEEFISGRPVECVEVTSAPIRKENPSPYTLWEIEHVCLRPFTLGTVPVRQLRFVLLDWNLTILAKVAELFPMLEMLYIDIHNVRIDENWLYHDGAFYLSGLPYLRQASIVKKTWGALAHQRQMEVVQAWGEACPKLEEASLAINCRWVKLDSNEWKQVVRKTWGESWTQK